MSDSLQTVLVLRRRAVEEARQRLAAALAVAAEAATAARCEDDAIRHETATASDPRGDDRLVEAFAAWLPAAKARAAQARDRLERQEAEVARCRADLAASRTALESVEQLVAERRAAAARARAEQEALALDDTIASRHRPG